MTDAPKTRVYMHTCRNSFWDLAFGVTYEHQWHTMFSLATSHFPTLPYRLITRCSRHLSRIPLWSISLVVDLRLLDLSGCAVSFCLIRSPVIRDVGVRLAFRLCPLSAASLPFLRPPASSSAVFPRSFSLRLLPALSTLESGFSVPISDPLPTPIHRQDVCHQSEQLSLDRRQHSDLSERTCITSCTPHLTQFGTIQYA